MNDIYPIVEVHPTELHRAPYQPPSRDEISSAMNALKKSIQDEGLQYPPLVVRRPDGNGYTIVDGHRRVKVATQLKWPKIPVIVSTQGDARKLFSAVSGTSKPLSAVEWIQVHLGGGALPSGPNTSCISKLESLMGRDFLEELVEKRLSPQIWNLSARVLRYLSLTDDERPGILRWLAKHKLTRQVSAAIQGDTPASDILGAYKGDSPRV